MFQAGPAVDYFIGGQAKVEDLRRVAPWCNELLKGDFNGKVHRLADGRGAGMELAADGQILLVVWALHYGNYDFVSSDTGEELIGLCIRDRRDLGVMTKTDRIPTFLDNESRLVMEANTPYKVLASGSVFFIQKFASDQT